MSENTPPDPKAEEILKARNGQSSIDNSDSGVEDKALTSSDDGKKKESFKIAKLVWNWTGFGDKKLWDIIHLLGLPTVLALAGFWFQISTKDREESFSNIKTGQEIKVADNRARQETLTKYLDQMSDLLEKGLLKSKQDSPIFIIAQSKTVTALQSLDTERQRLLIQFFKSANLNTLDGGKGLLFRARMSKAQLQKIDLRGINLKEVDLTEVDLSGADLSGANLSGANLSGANLSNITLNSANLKGASLVYTNLRKASLMFANFDRVNFKETDLEGSDLYKAIFDNSLMLKTYINDVINLDEKQLSTVNRPLICRVAMPKDIKTNGERDCVAMRKALLKWYPESIKTITDAEGFIDPEPGGPLD